MINWKKDGERRGGELYPDGVYKVGITNWEYTTATTGMAQVRVKAEIVEPDDHAGKTIVDHFALSDAAQWKIARLVCAIIDKDTLPNMEPNTSAFNSVLDQLVGQSVYWVNQQRAYNGTPRNDIVDWKPTKDDLIEFVGKDDILPDFLKEE